MCVEPQMLQVARQQLSLQIRCARVGGVEIPNQKRIEFSLQYVFGVGHTTAKAILAETVGWHSVDVYCCKHKGICQSVALRQ